MHPISDCKEALTTWPCPICSPTWKVRLEIASKAARLRSSTSVRPAAIRVSAPPSAPALPPLTGESIKSMPRSASGSSSACTSDGRMVAVTITVDPGERPSTAPRSPKSASFAWPPFITITKSASDLAPASAQLWAATPPAARSKAPRSARRSKPIVGKPPLAKFRAIPMPICPRPITPTGCMFRPFARNSGGEQARCPGALRRQDPPPAARCSGDRSRRARS